MREITVGNRKERKVLKINIGEDSYSLPLMGSLTIEEAERLGTQEGSTAFLTDHIPNDVLKTLTVDDLNTILEVWRSESKFEGASLGES